MRILPINNYQAQNQNNKNQNVNFGVKPPKKSALKTARLLLDAAINREGIEKVAQTIVRGADKATLQERLAHHQSEIDDIQAALKTRRIGDEINARKRLAEHREAVAKIKAALKKQ